MNMKIKMMLLDIFIYINECYMYVIKQISSFFTVTVDPFKISTMPINFMGKKIPGSYMIISSVNEYNRRVVHWFYRNNKYPNLKDWNNCLLLFGLKSIPRHVLQLYNYNNEPMNKFITVHSVTCDDIQYTYTSMDDNIIKTVTVPIGIASLIPEQFMFNLNLYYKSNNT